MSDQTSNNSTNKPYDGVALIYGILAYGLWGFIPIYFKSVSSVTPLEVLFHRIFWSFVLMIFVITYLKSWKRIVGFLKSLKTIAILSLTSLLVLMNWFAFIHAVNTNQVNEASLGYFINPLVNIGLGMLFLKERLRPLQKVALVLAIIAVSFLTIREGIVPYLSLIMAVSFGTYGILRKVIKPSANEGFFLEMLFALPIAIVGFVILSANNALGFLNGSTNTDLLLIAAGFVTTTPLVLFALAVRRLPYSMMGFLQYLAPSLQFLLAVLIYGEVIKLDRLLAFILIWIGLALISYDAVRKKKQPVENNRLSENLASTD